MDSTTNNESYNADELEAPEWLNAQYFEEVIRQHEKTPEVKVTEIKMSPASAKGDHYASVMFRGNISYTTPKGKFSKSLIIKTMPEMEGHKKEMLGDSYLFKTEIAMYTKILPEFEKILRKVGDQTILGASCLYHSLEPRQVLIFEDLVPQGYTVMRDRDATEEELKAVYTKLAKLHAISFKMLDEKPDYLKEFKNGIFEIPNFIDDPFMSAGMENFITMIKKLPEFSKYVTHFEKLRIDYMDRAKDILQEYRVNRKPDGYYVLCHGDFHLRNMMFQYNPTNGAFKDIMLLDFQMSNLCPITNDLIYSIYMLMGPECRKNNYKDMLNFYFETFVETLQKIGYMGKLPNVTDFWKQMSQHKAYDIFLLTTFFPMMCAIKENNCDPAELIQNNDARLKMYFTDGFQEELRYLLPRLEDLGYLD
ncbi:hypothetical protein KR093_003192 [Drosophila rubida]|uniref:CHK kinase-like domain-containing protein n=1 Tax=Drosophila rubida TaxID=30044 RepID=A0AAD4JT09_9MUSC|nr:hypothetical protein KR093_003192 [Drosophila rubida]